VRSAHQSLFPLTPRFQKMKNVEVFNMKLDISKVEFSRNDIKRGIRIPKKMDQKLAEFLGIMVGDGHVGLYQGKRGKVTYKHYEIYVTGNIKDYDYYTNYVNPLIFDLFGIKLGIKKRAYDNTTILTRNSKAIYYLLSKCFKIPQRKDNIRIPKQIMESSVGMKSAFLRGFADADFTLTLKRKEGILYPVIQGCSKSPELIKDVCLILDELGIKHCKFREEQYYAKRDATYIRHRIYVNGRKRIHKWFSKVGFSNPRHKARFNEYLEYRRGRQDSN
jgi:intein/homing endonuclease